MKKKRTVRKSTILKVYKEIALGPRSEIKLVARKLRISKTSAKISLELLSKFNLIKKRTYSDIGVSFYYPSDQRVYTVIITSFTRSYLILINSKIEVLDYLEFVCSDNLLPDENLHCFLKNAREFIKNYSYYKFPSPLYFFIPMKKSSSKKNEYEYLFPEYRLIDLPHFICERINIRKTVTIPYLCTRTLNIKDKEDMCSLMCALLSKLITKSKNKNKADCPK